MKCECPIEGSSEVKLVDIKNPITYIEEDETSGYANDAM